MLSDRQATRTRRWLVWVLLCAAALAVVATGGCWRSEPAEAEKKLAEAEKKKPQPPFEALRVFTEPNEQSTIDPKQKENRRIVNAAKPGHWTGVLVQTKANRFDFGGRLASVPQDSRQRPIDLERSPFWLATSRPVALPKGQRKTLETLFFAPRPDPTAAVTGSTWIGNKLYDSRGREELAAADFIAHMPGFQYYLFVLAREPDRYRYLKVLDSVRPPTDLLGPNVDDSAYYRVQFPQPGQPLALPSQPLCWTSIAQVVWDNVLPGALSPEQQRAMIDWLHWGGGLIVSGPDSLDGLRGSFLDRYLPAESASAGTLDPAKLAELHAHWTIAGDNGRPLGTRAAAPWSGIELVNHSQAQFLPGTGGLVAERRVGRGRIVVTAFRLSEPELIAWRSYDSFFNACILRRQPREYDAQHNRFVFVGPDVPDEFDPAVASNVRFLTRDVQDSNTEQVDTDNADPAGPSGNASPAFGSYVPEAGAIDRFKADSGVAGWNDFSWFSDVARQTLRDAAGISVPRRTFVLKMIGLYLLVVVGVNWLVFRLLGRVEWAWIAVPAIAVGWGVVVVWLAQLDIGFARSETEVAVLEVQPDYGRGHLTRYTALYSSLSTSYDLHFDEPSAVALPFSADRQLLSGQSSWGVTFTTVGDHELSDFPVTSNSTGMIHSEQMFDVGGGIAWQSGDDQPPTIENNTHLQLAGAAVVRRRVDADGHALNESAWIGDLEPGGRVEVRFRKPSSSELGDARRRGSLSADNGAKGALSLRRLIDCAEDYRSLEPGEVRLVAVHDGGLGKIEVRPGSSQVRRATLVVAHLQYGNPPPKPDANLRTPTAPPNDSF